MYSITRLLPFSLRKRKHHLRVIIVGRKDSVSNRIKVMQEMSSALAVRGFNYTSSFPNCHSILLCEHQNCFQNQNGTFLLIVEAMVVAGIGFDVIKKLRQELDKRRKCNQIIVLYPVYV